MRIGNNDYKSIVVTNLENEVLATIFEHESIKIIENGVKVHLGNDFSFKEVDSKEGVKILLNF